MTRTPEPGPGSAPDTPTPSERELRRLYERCVAPDLLVGAQTAEHPVAMVIAGQPGAGLTYSSVMLRQQLMQTVPTAAHVSLNRLRAYHPLWAAGGDVAPPAAAQVTAHCQAWFDRFVTDVQTRRLNLVAEVETTDIEAVPRLAADLRRGGYIVQAVFVGTNREESRLAMLARYEMRRRAGLGAEAPSIQAHELAFSNVGSLLGRLEHERMVDGLRVITRSGTQLYESRVLDGVLNRVPRAAETLRIHLERATDARELVQYAMRWETLVQRLTGDPAVPRDIAGRTVIWRNEAAARCEQDPDAKQMLQWAREAGAFRVMNRFEFEKEFPHLARAVAALGEAVLESERFPPREAARLLAHARENIAQRIERGDMARIIARQKAMEMKAQGKAKTQPDRERTAKEPPSEEPPTR
ncbi:hypothetical protein GCM10023165_30600 [Variovorax defluvii]|uniref:Zeta toxin domain-containing protein n=1 Tax=Variovorax defluvii TaxID=913761 RepID=A0ABP8HWH7_9BURK